MQCTWNREQETAKNERRPQEGTDTASSVPQEGTDTALAVPQEGTDTALAVPQYLRRIQILL